MAQLHSANIRNITTCNRTVCSALKKLTGLDDTFLDVIAIVLFLVAVTSFQHFLMSHTGYSTALRGRHTEPPDLVGISCSKTVLLSPFKSWGHWFLESSGSHEWRS